MIILSALPVTGHGEASHPLGPDQVNVIIISQCLGQAAIAIHCPVGASAVPELVSGLLVHLLS
jgi:hypothetical protein